MTYYQPTPPQNYMYYPPQGPKRHCGFGITSLVLAALAYLSCFGNVGISFVTTDFSDTGSMSFADAFRQGMQEGQDAASPLEVAGVVLSCAAMLLLPASAVFGIISCFRSSRRRLFGIIGLIASGIGLLVLAGLFAIVVVMIAGAGGM